MTTADQTENIEIQGPPEGGIFLPPELISAQTLDLVAHYDDLIAESWLGQAELDTLISPDDPNAMKNHRKLVADFMILTQDKEPTDDNKVKQAELARELSKRNDAMRRASLAHEASTIIRRDSERLMKTLFNSVPKGYYTVGDHTYWVASYGTAFEPAPVFLRLKLEDVEDKIVLYTDGELAADYLGLRSKGSDPNCRGASTFDYAIFIRDMAKELAGMEPSEMASLLKATVDKRADDPTASTRTFTAETLTTPEHEDPPIAPFRTAIARLAGFLGVENSIHTMNSYQNDIKAGAQRIRNGASAESKAKAHLAENTERVMLEEFLTSLMAEIEDSPRDLILGIPDDEGLITFMRAEELIAEFGTRHKDKDGGYYVVRIPRGRLTQIQASTLAQPGSVDPVIDLQIQKTSDPSYQRRYFVPSEDPDHPHEMKTVFEPIPTGGTWHRVPLLSSVEMVLHGQSFTEQKTSHDPRETAYYVHDEPFEGTRDPIPPQDMDHEPTPEVARKAKENNSGFPINFNLIY